MRKPAIARDNLVDIGFILTLVSFRLDSHGCPSQYTLVFKSVILVVILKLRILFLDD